MRLLKAISVWRSRLKPQFGLRTMFLAITLCSLGLGWWSKPFEVEERFEPARLYPCEPPGSYYACSFEIQLNERRLPREGIGRVVRGLKRRFWDSPIPHGRTTYYFHRDDKPAIVESFRHGVRHGPEIHFHPNGGKMSACQWEAGELHGDELVWDKKGNVTSRKMHNHGTPVGVWLTVHPFSGHRHESEYRNGTVVRQTHISEQDIQETLRWDDVRGTESVWTSDHRQQLEFATFGEHGYEGPAFAWHRNGSPRYEGWWRAGQRDGRWTFWDDQMLLAWSVDYDHGDCIAINGAPALGLPPYAPEPTRLDFALDQSTSNFVVFTWPLDEIAQHFAESNKVPIAVDNRLQRLPGWSGEINAPSLHDAIPIAEVYAPSHVVLSEAFRARGVTWQVRFEQLWFVSQAEGKNWRDRTGVYALPTDPDLSITGVLNSPTDCEFVETPLVEVIQYLEERHRTPFRFCADDIELIEIAEKTLINVNIRGISLRATLGALCDQNGLRCDWEGGALVIRRLADEEVIGQAFLENDQQPSP